MPKFLIKPSTNRQLSCLHFLTTMNSAETNKGMLVFLHTDFSSFGNAHSRRNARWCDNSVFTSNICSYQG